MKESNRSEKPSSITLKLILAGLREIEAYFGWEVTRSDSNGDDIPTEGQVSYSDDNESPYEQTPHKGDVEREEVEIAIDAFLSQLEGKVIRKDKSGKLPTFAEVFERFLGEEHPATEAADRFEKYVAGYFGWIDYGNMEAARKEFLEICELVRQELEDSDGA